MTSAALGRGGESDVGPLLLARGEQDIGALRAEYPISLEEQFRVGLKSAMAATALARRRGHAWQNSLGRHRALGSPPVRRGARSPNMSY